MYANRAHFFSGCKNPANVSELVTALACGVALQAERLPMELLPAVVLLATIGIRTYGQQIVDDYVLLLQRTAEVIKDSTVLHDRFWHPNLYFAISVVERGPRGQYTLDSVPDLRYAFGLYESLVNAEETELFPEGVENVLQANAGE